MANNDREGFLTRIYKNLFITPADMESIENEVRTEKVLDNHDGIYDAAVNKKFNLNTKGNIFSGIEGTKETRIANKRSISKKPATKNENTILNTSILENINLHRGEKPPETGNKFDQLT